MGRRGWRAQGGQGVPSRRARGGSQSAGVRPDAVVLLCQSFSSLLTAGQTSRASIDIERVIRSRSGGRDEEQRGLCYDKPHVWVVIGTVTFPETLPCGLQGEVRPVGKGSSSPALWRHIKRYGISRRLYRSRRYAVSMARRRSAEAAVKRRSWGVAPSGAWSRSS